MRITRAYKTALDPTPVQADELRKIVGACRFVWNAALSQREMLWRQWGMTVSAFDQMKELTTARSTEGLEWLQEPPRSSLNAVIQNLDRAYAATFRRLKRNETPGFPKYHGRNFGRGGFKIFTQSRQEIAAVVLPKVGRVKLHEHGYLPEGVVKIRSGSVTFDGHRWYISLTVDEEVAAPVTTGSTLTVHLGLTRLAWLHIQHTDGREARWSVENPKTLATYLDRLRLLQRRHSRRTKGSARRDDARRAVARLHEHIAAIRADILHKLTTEIIERRPSRIVIQGWEVAGMLEQKKCSRLIADASWGELRRMLSYKAGWIGATVIEVPAEYPASKRCSRCGEIDQKFPLGAEIYDCVRCGMVRDREANAIENLRSWAEDNAGVPIRSKM